MSTRRRWWPSRTAPSGRTFSAPGRPGASDNINSSVERLAKQLELDTIQSCLRVQKFQVRSYECIHTIIVMCRSAITTLSARQTLCSHHLPRPTSATPPPKRTRMRAGVEEPYPMKSCRAAASTQLTLGRAASIPRKLARYSERSRSGRIEQVRAQRGRAKHAATARDSQRWVFIIALHVIMGSCERWCQTRRVPVGGCRAGVHAGRPRLHGSPH
jgi:hypothetical protein